MRNHQSWAFATIFATMLSQRDNVARPNNFSLVTLSLTVRIMPRLALSLSKKIVAYSALAIKSSYMDIEIDLTFQVFILMNPDPGSELLNLH